jgi:tol-pal system protein YbgF
MTQNAGTTMTHFRRRALALSVAAFAVLAGLAPLHAQDAADILLRLDRLEAENRRLTGSLDEVRFQNRKLEDQLKRFQTDADSRFRDLEGGKGNSGGGGGGGGSSSSGGGAPSTPRVIPTAPGTGGKRTDAYDPGQNGNAPGAPRTLGSAAPVGGDVGAPLDMTRGGNPAVAGGNPATAGSAPGSDARSSFDYARGLIERGEYENGETAMRDFQRKFARDKRSPEATFWIGESYLRRTRYREAAENFLTVTTKHSGIAKAPEAMLKLGISLRGLGATSEACGTFDQVNKKYPNAGSSIKQAVEREKTRAKCA